MFDENFILTWDDRLNVDRLNSLIRSKGSESIELLVLSACETLTGDKRASLGLAGVAIRAGARSTLATLWQVNDRTTALLMDRFYRALNDPNITKADALRQAQLSLLQDPAYSRPHCLIHPPIMQRLFFYFFTDCWRLIPDYFELL